MDVVAVTRAHRTKFESWSKNSTPSLARFTSPNSGMAWLSTRSSSRTSASSWHAEKDAQLDAGASALFTNFAEVKRMYVRPELRGQGVADAIITRLVAETRNAGLSVLRLETGTKSFAAIQFYRKCGFRDCPAFAPYASLPPHRIAASVFLERPVP